MDAEQKERTIRELKKYTGLSREIRQAEEEIARMESRIEYHRAEGERSGGQTGRDQMAGVISGLTDLKDRRQEMLMQRICERNRIDEAVDKLDDPRERLVLNLRYIQGMPWQEVYWRIGCEWRTMFRIHAEAIKHLDLFS